MDQLPGEKNCIFAWLSLHGMVARLAWPDSSASTNENINPAFCPNSLLADEPDSSIL
jgi:hypothetical protein